MDLLRHQLSRRHRHYHWWTMARMETLTWMAIRR
jgi:hypothetical protein